MGYFFIALFFLVAGYALGVFSANDFRKELITARVWISKEISALHGKLDSILAAVSPK
jgi:hypothetical protein